MIWKDKDLYANVMSILGGFIENKNWFIDSEIIAPEIGEQALEGRHYCITFDLCVCKAKRLQQLFKQV